MAREKGWYWPWLIVGILAAGMIPNLVFVAIAVNDPSFAVEKDYYEKAKHWDEEMARRRASRALGWRVELEVQPAGELPGFRQIVAVVRDRNGVPLENCRVELEAFHNARAANRLTAVLDRDGTRHTATLPMRRAGIWIFNLAVEREGRAYFEMQRRELPAVLP